MLAALTFVALLVHQTLLKDQQRRCYDRCGLLMSPALAALVLRPVLPALLLTCVECESGPALIHLKTDRKD